MILKKLYTSPTNLFEPVNFRIGLNFIYGIKDNPLESNDSLNAIGKSLFLDFLDFALLGHFSISRNNRLSKAYNAGIIRKHSVVLEFEIGDKPFSISRFFDDPYIAYFSGKNYPRKKYKLSELQPLLFELIFNRKDYPGYSVDSWYRDLMKFFLKIQKVSDEKFLNPVRYMNSKEIILNQYHLFLLNINNLLAVENHDLVRQLDNYKKTIDTTKQLLSETHNLKDFASVQNKITGLDNQIKKINDAINSFRLSSLHQVLQQRAAAITAEMKSLGFLNSSDSNRIIEYQDSTKDSRFTADQVKAVYDEIYPELGNLIKEKIDDAISFREQLITSRKDFIEKEIRTLKWRIKSVKRKFLKCRMNYRVFLKIYQRKMQSQI